MIKRFEEFTSAISAIYRDIQKIERDEMERYGLKGAYAQYLLAISHRPDGITAAQLCEICDKNKAAVSRILTEMESAGLVIRSANPYKALLKLTQKGIEAVDYVKERCSAATVLAGEGLSDQDRSVFYATMHRIASNLQKLSETGIPCTNPIITEGDT